MKAKVNGINNTIEINRGNEKDDVFAAKLIELKGKDESGALMILFAKEEQSQAIKDVCSRLQIEIRLIEQPKEEQNELFTIRDLWNNTY